MADLPKLPGNFVDFIGTNSDEELAALRAGLAELLGRASEMEDSEWNIVLAVPAAELRVLLTRPDVPGPEPTIERISAELTKERAKLARAREVIARTVKELGEISKHLSGGGV